MLEAFKRAEVTKRWELKELFEDVYGGEEPWNLVSHVRQPRNAEVEFDDLPERAERRARGIAKKVWQRLGTLATRVGEI